MHDHKNEIGNPQDLLKVQRRARWRINQNKILIANAKRCQSARQPICIFSQKDFERVPVSFIDGAVGQHFWTSRTLKQRCIPGASFKGATCKSIHLIHLNAKVKSKRILWIKIDANDATIVIQCSSKVCCQGCFSYAALRGNNGKNIHVISFRLNKPTAPCALTCD